MSEEKTVLWIVAIIVGGFLGLIALVHFAYWAEDEHVVAAIKAGATPIQAACVIKEWQHRELLCGGKAGAP